MGIFSSKSRTLENTDEEQQDVKKRSGFLSSIIDGGLGTGKYAKSDEQKQEEVESRSLPSRLGGLRVKRYNRSMSFRFNDNKNRIEVGENFTMNKLPEVVYSLADGSTIFRKAIGGGFDFSEREKLRRIIRKKRNKMQKIERQLTDGNERRQQVYLKELF
jgi:hypothetical protein